MTQYNKPKLIAYCHPPCSPGIHELHMMMFHTLSILQKKYDIYVLCRSQDVYAYYTKVLLQKYPNFNIISCNSNISGNIYKFGELEEALNYFFNGQDAEIAYWFSSGLLNVTSESLTKFIYDNLLNGNLRNSKMEVCDKDLPVVLQAEMLHLMTKRCKKLVYRVIDYTEMHLENFVKMPIKMLSFHDDADRNHKKIHDVEAFHFGQKHEIKDKIYDFVFGWTVEIPERTYLSDFCFEHIQENDKFKLYVKDKYYSRYAPINTLLKSEEYLDKIGLAKFSLIAPSTDVNEVSLIRVYEDISRRCVPIFMKNVKYWKTFDKEMSDFIRDNLIYDKEKEPDFNRFIESLDYENLISRIYECKLIKDALDADTIADILMKEIML